MINTLIRKKVNKLLTIVFVFTVVLFSTSYASTIVTKRVHVEVISGTYAGEKGSAIFSYDRSKAKGLEQESIEGKEIIFKILGQTVRGMPQIILNNGQFKDVAWVSSIRGPDGERFNFGFNSGFERYQFNRQSEAFIQNGESYFGYLFPNTFVDGAGIISYSDVKIMKKYR